MNARDMRHRICLQRFEATKDADGFNIKEWKDVLHLWAAVENLSGREYFEAAAVQMEQSIRFTMRCHKGITQDMRILFHQEAYEIVSIDNSSYQNKELVILASKIEKERASLGGQ